MWYLDYHGFEATIQLSTGRNGAPTSNMVQILTGCLLANQGIPPSYSFEKLQSWTFFRYFHPVPRKRVRLRILGSNSFILSSMSSSECKLLAPWVIDAGR